jgi:hypothetical protein
MVATPPPVEVADVETMVLNFADAPGIVVARNTPADPTTPTLTLSIPVPAAFETLTVITTKSPTFASACAAVSVESDASAVGFAVWVPVVADSGTTPLVDVHTVKLPSAASDPPDVSVTEPGAPSAVAV